MKVIDKYTYRVMWSEDDCEFIGQCSEFPSLSWLAESQVDAMVGIQELVASVLRDMKKTGEQPPEPLGAKKYSGKFLVRVTPDRHRALTIEAAEHGVSLNRLVSSKLAG